MNKTSRTITASIAMLSAIGLSACGNDSSKNTSNTAPKISTSTMNSSTPSSSTLASSDASISASSTTSPSKTSGSSTTDAPSSSKASSTSTPASKSQPSTSSGVSVAEADPATASKSAGSAAKQPATLAIGGKKLSVPSGMTTISSDGASARLMRGDSVVIMLSSATGVEELGPLQQRCAEAGQQLSASTTEHTTPKVTMSTKGSAQVCSVTVNGTLQGQKTKGNITMYDVLDAAGTDYVINSQDFSTHPSSKDADALRDSLLASVSKEPKAVG